MDRFVSTQLEMALSSESTHCHLTSLCPPLGGDSQETLIACSVYLTNI